MIQAFSCVQEPLAGNTVAVVRPTRLLWARQGGALEVPVTNDLTDLVVVGQGVKFEFLLIAPEILPRLWVVANFVAVADPIVVVAWLLGAFFPPCPSC